jgi:hypothetical protein
MHAISLSPLLELWSVIGQTVIEQISGLQYSYCERTVQQTTTSSLQLPESLHAKLHSSFLLIMHKTVEVARFTASILNYSFFVLTSCNRGLPRS